MKTTGGSPSPPVFLPDRAERKDLQHTTMPLLVSSHTWTGASVTKGNCACCQASKPPETFITF